MTIDEDVAADFRQMGHMVDRAEIPKQEDDEAFEIWEENWISLCAFLAVETQWRTIIAGTAMIMQGLDYSAVDVVMRRRSLPDEVFGDLQIMETAALAVLSESSQ